jgi:membrane protein
VTALLFVIGKFLIGLYLGKGDVGSSFGAFGSIVIVMVWVYYSAQIFLFGAEFTWVYAHARGSRRGEQAQKANLGEAIAPAQAASPAVSARAAPLGERRRAWDSQNALVYALQRKGLFGATLAAAFLGGAVLRVVVASR